MKYIKYTMALSCVIATTTPNWAIPEFPELEFGPHPVLNSAWQNAISDPEQGQSKLSSLTEHHDCRPRAPWDTRPLDPNNPWDIPCKHMHKFMEAIKVFQYDLDTDRGVRAICEEGSRFSFTRESRTQRLMQSARWWAALDQATFEARFNEVVDSLEISLDVDEVLEAMNKSGNIENMLEREKQAPRREISLPFQQETWPEAQNQLQDTSGLSGQEAWGTWSEGKDVVLSFEHHFPTRFKLNLTASAFGPNVNQDFVMEVGDVRHTFRLGRHPIQVTLPFYGHKPTEDLRIYVPDPKSPSELGMSRDPRALGIGLRSLDIVEQTFLEQVTLRLALLKKELEVGEVKREIERADARDEDNAFFGAYERAAAYYKLSYLQKHNEDENLAACLREILRFRIPLEELMTKGSDQWCFGYWFNMPKAIELYRTTFLRYIPTYFADFKGMPELVRFFKEQTGLAFTEENLRDIPNQFPSVEEATEYIRSQSTTPAS